MLLSKLSQICPLLSLSPLLPLWSKAPLSLASITRFCLTQPRLLDAFILLLSLSSNNTNPFLFLQYSKPLLPRSLGTSCFTYWECSFFLSSPSTSFTACLYLHIMSLFKYHSHKEVFLALPPHSIPHPVSVSQCFVLYFLEHLQGYYRMGRSIEESHRVGEKASGKAYFSSIHVPLTRIQSHRPSLSKGG